MKTFNHHLFQSEDIVQNISEDDLWWRNGINLHLNNVTLIGFSKGCVVLNQFLHEFHNLISSEPCETLDFVRRIKDMYWLDGGHSGGKNVWITSKSLLETVLKLGNK